MIKAMIKRIIFGPQMSSRDRELVSLIKRESDYIKVVGRGTVIRTGFSPQSRCEHIKTLAQLEKLVVRN